MTEGERGGREKEREEHDSGLLAHTAKKSPGMESKFKLYSVEFYVTD